MFKLVVFCLLFFSAWTSLNRCGPNYQEIIKGEGITIAKQQEWTQAFNIYRNQVARGAIENWENKGMTASMMNYIQWDNKMAAAAQECANLCVEAFAQCDLPKEYAKFQWMKQSSGLQAFNYSADGLVKQWTKEIYYKKQLEQGDLTHFGCGIVQIEQKQRNLEFRDFLLCLFDKNTFEKELDHLVIYEGGPIGSKCPNGLMSGPYQALCKQ